MTLSEHQLKKRKNHVGSSEASALFGCNPWMTKTDLYWHKVRDEIPAQKGNASTKAGNFFEEFAIKYARQELGIKGLVANQHRVDRQHTSGILSATYDALSTQENLAVEAKYSIKHDEWGDPNDSKVIIPTQYLIQCHVQRIVCNLDRVILVRIKPTNFGIEFDCYEILEDEEIEGAIIEKTLDFWNNHVIPQVPPTNDPPPMELLKAYQRQPLKEAVLNDGQLLDADLLASGYDAAHKEEQAAKAKKERLKASMIHLLGDDAEIAKFPGGYFTYKSTKGKAPRFHYKVYEQ
ncbi:MAG: YqaJ viral recombinase family protein [Epibacterium sp.]|nr:YqaJ viral recombinase family protein [Epibacterium sp.]NQX73794.1 YqaJ viral recombinase family protein [Epibacterium sp.]